MTAVIMLVPLMLLLPHPASLSAGFPSWCPPECASSNRSSHIFDCTNKSPSLDKDCYQYMDDGKCYSPELKGFCCAACCNPRKCEIEKTCLNKCNNEPPPSNYSSRTCEEHARSGSCGQTWMEGYCCKLCANRDKCDFVEGCRKKPCSDEPPPQFEDQLCKDLASIGGGCGHWYMKGYCCLSCLNSDTCGNNTNPKINLLIYGLISIAVLVVFVLASFYVRGRIHFSCFGKAEDEAHLIPSRPPSVPDHPNRGSIEYDGP